MKRTIFLKGKMKKTVEASKWRLSQHDLRYKI